MDQYNILKIDNNFSVLSSWEKLYTNLLFQLTIEESSTVHPALCKRLFKESVLNIMSDWCLEEL